MLMEIWVAKMLKICLFFSMYPHMTSCEDPWLKPADQGNLHHLKRDQPGVSGTMGEPDHHPSYQEGCNNRRSGYHQESQASDRYWYKMSVWCLLLRWGTFGSVKKWQMRQRQILPHLAGRLRFVQIEEIRPSLIPVFPAQWCWKPGSHHQSGVQSVAGLIRYTPARRPIWRNRESRSCSVKGVITGQQAGM